MRKKAILFPFCPYACKSGMKRKAPNRSNDEVEDTSKQDRTVGQNRSRSFGEPGQKASTSTAVGEPILER